MSSDSVYNGSCFCGSVQFTVSGDPALMEYCHCNSCRHWSASPVNAFTLWNPAAVKITKGEDNVDSFEENPGTDDKTVYSIRKWCKSCGGHFLSEHPGMGLVDVYAGALPDLPFAPSMHVHYQETVLPLKDGLPKMRDLPAEAGGSGEVMPE